MDTMAMPEGDDTHSGSETRETHNVAGTSDTNNPFIPWLNQQLDELGVTRKSFCERAGIDPGGFSRIMKMQTDADISTIQKVVTAINELLREGGKETLNILEIIGMAQGITPDTETKGKTLGATIEAIAKKNHLTHYEQQLLAENASSLAQSLAKARRAKLFARRPKK
jgi:transcriptional regulator with XRE-family HTH domain